MMNSSLSSPSIPLRFFWLTALLGTLQLVGCVATTPVKAPVQQQTQATFYPPLPEAPRIQHLATFSSARDLAPNQEKSTLKDFLIGDDKTDEALARPYGVALFDGKIYVADSRGPGLAIFDLKSSKFALESGSGGGRLQRPINIAIDTDGTKYVTDLGRNQVVVFDKADGFLKTYGDKTEIKPVDIAIAGERLYVADIEHHEVLVLDKRTGKLLFKFGMSNMEEGKRLHQPTNLTIGPEGDVYVVETGNFRVARFTAEGKFVRHYGEVGQSPGQFARPKGIALDRAGRLYVSDAAFQNVQIFDNDGQILLAFGQPADGAQGLNLPAGVAIDYDNVEFFRRFADPKFSIEHLILVVSQFDPNKVDVFGFGKMSGIEYPPDSKHDSKKTAP